MGFYKRNGYFGGAFWFAGFEEVWESVYGIGDYGGEFASDAISLVFGKHVFCTSIITSAQMGQNIESKRRNFCEIFIRLGLGSSKSSALDCYKYMLCCHTQPAAQVCSCTVYISAMIEIMFILCQSLHEVSGLFFIISGGA